LKIKAQVKSYRESWGGLDQSRLFDLTQALLVDGREPIIGAVRLKGNPKTSEDTESIKSLTPKALVELSGMAVFRGDKLIGFLTAEESRMVVMARNEMRATTLSVPLEEKGTYAAIRSFRFKSKMQVTMVNGKPNLRLILTGQGLIASIDKKENLGEVSGYQHLEDLTSKYVQQQLSMTIQSVQRKFGVDIFGFGENLYRRHYKQYQKVAGQWNELFAKTPVNVEANITLLRAELKTDQIKKNEIGP
jgi:spore germination protein KC